MGVEGPQGRVGEADVEKSPQHDHTLIERKECPKPERLQVGEEVLNGGTDDIEPSVQDGSLIFVGILHYLKELGNSKPFF